MSAATLAGLVGAALVGLGLYGLIINPHPLRKILAFNVIGSGVFLLFGIIARKGAAAGFAADPVPQAMVITGIVVAFAAARLRLPYCCGFSSRRAALHCVPTPGRNRRATGRAGMTVAAPAFVTTAGGSLLVLAIILPVFGVLLSLVLG
jgi:multicomponent Na+:H+ antiporter subunit C